jgi:phosphohistidine phosphatase SixA
MLQITENETKREKQSGCQERGRKISSWSLGSQNVRANPLESDVCSRQILTMNSLALILSLTLLFAHPTNAAPIVFIVRHAGKAGDGGKDPDLSPEGQKRADVLASILRDSRITSVFVTEFKRTQQTASPTAKTAHVNPIVVPANDVEQLVGKLRTSDGNALVVGHGNTVPELLKALGVVAPISIPDDDYNEIFAVLTGETPQLLRLHYPF